MIISCPNCSAGFFVSPQQIGEAGRRVKCSKCKNVWHATIDQNKIPNDEIIARRIQDQKYVSGSNLPAVIPIKIPNLLYYLPGVLLTLIIVSIFTLYPSMYNITGIYGPMNVPEGLKIEQVIHDFNKERNHVSVEYSVINRSNSPQKVPLVQLKLIDKDDNVLRTAYADGNGMILEPNKMVRAKSEFNDVKSTSKFVEIALGSRLKFWVK